MSPMSAYVSSLYKRCFSKDKHQIVIVKTAEDWLLAFQIMKADLDILKVSFGKGSERIANLF